MYRGCSLTSGQACRLQFSRDNVMFSFGTSSYLYVFSINRNQNKFVMNILKSVFGVMPEGRDIDQYSLENDQGYGW